MKTKINLFLVITLLFVGLLSVACGSTDDVERPGETTITDPGTEGETPGDELDGEQEDIVPLEDAEPDDTPLDEEESGMIPADELEVDEQILGTAEDAEPADEVVDDSTEALTEPAEADDALDEVVEDTTAPLEQETEQVTEAPYNDQRMVKVSEIMDLQVQNDQGEDLGEIEDLMIDLQNEQVRYAVLSFGGFLDIGDKLFAIPVSALSFDHSQGTFLFNVDQATLENAPGFEANAWPNTDEADWARDYEDYWHNYEMLTRETDPFEETNEQVVTGEVTESGELVQDETMATGAIVRASELLDYEIVTVQEEAAGEVEDVMVDMATGQVPYVVVTLDEALISEADDIYFALSPSDLELNPQQDTLILQADSTTIENAPSFNEDEWSTQFNFGEELSQIVQ